MAGRGWSELMALVAVRGGSWENWRPDKDDFPPEILGNHFDGWAGERWLDVRRIDVLGPIHGGRARSRRVENRLSEQSVTAH
jgi:hypothetical protein